MERLRARRWLILGAALVAGLLIKLLASHYLDVQKAADADALRAAVPDAERGRYVAAAAVDLVLFAPLYALTAVAFARRALASRLGALLLCAAALADEVENVYVLRNVRGEATVTDGAVAAMRTWGTAKTWLFVAGGVLMVGTAVLDRRRT